ncbi:MAG: CHRD domain-containing protein [Gaiellaceae bacterium]
MKLRALLAVLAAGLAVSGTALASAVAMHPELSAKLVPAAEAMTKGPAKAHGIVNLTLTAAKGKVCWSFDIGGVQSPTAAHIHKGVVGKEGPVVVPLGARYSAKGCTAAPAKTLDAIEAHPNSYYVNVHNKQFPNGAIRGQLVVGMMHM